MGGIAAIIDFGGPCDLQAQVRAMTAVMAYRGSDGIAHWHEPGAAFGYCAMHTTAEAAAGAQPLVSADARFVVLFDGYLFNHAELLATLRDAGQPAAGNADVALVLSAWLAWGENCPVRLEGEFSALVWDKAERRLFAFRDHQGLRPLYMYRHGERLIMASDLAAILAVLDQAPQPNLGFLVEIAAGEHLVREDTPWQNVQRVVPAHLHTIDRSGLRSREYWTLPTDVTIRYRRSEDYVDHYRELLTRCVARASRTHRPLAFEVSGGLDSSAVFSIADQLEKAGKLAAPSMQGYTFDPPKGSAADELDYARDLAYHVGRDLVRVPLFTPDMSWFFETAHRNGDIAPFANMAMLVGLGERLVADGSRAVLNGQGGDMWLLGTPRVYFQALRYGEAGELLKLWRSQRRAGGVPFAARQAFVYGALPFVPKPIRNLLRTAKHTLLRQQDEYPPWLAAEARALLAERREQYRARETADVRQYKLSRLEHPFHLRIWDTMAQQQARLGYESRSPMLAREFMEFSARTPDHVKMQGMEQKVLHRQAMQRHLPQSILDRQTKAEFSVVYERHGTPLRQRLTAPEAGLPAIFDREGLRQAVTSYCTATLDAPSTWQVWGINSVIDFLLCFRADAQR